MLQPPPPPPGMYAMTQAQTVAQRGPALKPCTKMPVSLAQAPRGWGAAHWANGTFTGRVHATGTEKAMKAV